MISKKLKPILLITLTVSSIGCSGSRLRNMVGRSEYSSLHELNAGGADGTSESTEEAIANDEARERNSLFASRSRELPEDQEIVERKRGGFFDFAKVFNRSSDQDEFAPDPFAEPVVLGEKRPVRTVSASAQPEFAAETRAETKTENLDATIADVEKQAIDLFDQNLQAKNDKASTATEGDIFGTAAAQEQSFADFINRQPGNGGTVTESIKDVTEEIIVKASESTALATKFDSFLNGTPPQSEANDVAAADSSSDLFPGLSEAFSDAFDDNAKEKSGESKVAVVANANSPFNDNLGESFAEASRKHGFSNSDQKDPWAAFNNTNSSAKSVATIEKPTDTTPEGFDWTPANGSNNSDSSFAAIDDNSARETESAASFDDSFLHVSSTSTINTQPIDLSDSTPLVIPGTMSSDSSQSYSGIADHGSQQQQTAQSEPFGSDPFLTSLPEFDEALSEPTTDANVGAVAAAPATTTASSGLIRWSRRTWFLLIGCIIVGLLLFMPDRHNRTNA